MKRFEVPRLRSMRRVVIINEASDYAGREGYVAEADWGGRGFWVPVRLGNQRMLLARRNLAEISAVRV
jgi:hypothetical protein